MRAGVVKQRFDEQPRAAGGAPQRLEIPARVGMEILVETVSDGRGIGLGEDERREQLVRGYGTERLDFCLFGLKRSDATMQAPILGPKPVHRFSVTCAISDPCVIHAAPVEIAPG